MADDQNKHESEPVFTSGVIARGVLIGALVLAICGAGVWYFGIRENNQALSPTVSDTSQTTSGNNSTSGKDNTTTNKEENKTDEEKKDEEKTEEENKEDTENTDEKAEGETDQNGEASSENEFQYSPDSFDGAGVSAPTYVPDQTPDYSAPGYSEPDYSTPQTPAPAPTPDYSGSTGNTGSSSGEGSGSEGSSGTTTPSTPTVPTPSLENYPEGEYMMIYDVITRRQPYLSSEEVGSYPAGSQIRIYQIQAGNDGRIWGLSENGWVCLCYGTQQYTLNSGTYYFPYRMKIRSEPDLNAEQTGSIDAGSYVAISNIVFKNGADFWGEIEEGQWVCLVDINEFYAYK